MGSKLEFRVALKPEYAELSKKEISQLKKVKPETKKSVFEQFDGQVVRFISETYGQTAGEAGQKNLYANRGIFGQHDSNKGYVKSS